MEKELGKLIIDLLIWLDVQLNLKTGSYDKKDLGTILALVNDINRKHEKFENNIQRKEIIQDTIDNIYQEAKLYEEQEEQ